MVEHRMDGASGSIRQRAFSGRLSLQRCRGATGRGSGAAAEAPSGRATIVCGADDSPRRFPGFLRALRAGPGVLCARHLLVYGGTAVLPALSGKYRHGGGRKRPDRRLCDCRHQRCARERWWGGLSPSTWTVQCAAAVWVTSCCETLEERLRAQKLRWR